MEFLVVGCGGTETHLMMRLIKNCFKSDDISVLVDAKAYKDLKSILEVSKDINIIFLMRDAKGALRYEDFASWCGCAEAFGYFKDHMRVTPIRHETMINTPSIVQNFLQKKFGLTRKHSFETEISKWKKEPSITAGRITSQEEIGRDLNHPNVIMLRKRLDYYDEETE